MKHVQEDRSEVRRCRKEIPLTQEKRGDDVKKQSKHRMTSFKRPLQPEWRTQAM